MRNNTVTLENWLREEPFELSLGAGFFGFYAHVGFLKALEEKNLKPLKIYGSSAGAIVGAFLAQGYSATKIEEIFTKITRQDFWDPGIGAGILKGHKYHQLLNEYLPKSFNELKIPLEVAVFDLFSFCTRIFKSGALYPAIRGSSAFPLLFQPVKIGTRFYLDGGIGDQLGLSERSSNGRLLVHCFGMANLKDRSSAVVLSLKNLPKSGPAKMHLAAEIIEKAYRETKLRLHSKVY